eukprot:365790-Chlamydomonas_euryale.AAC.3
MAERAQHAGSALTSFHTSPPHLAERPKRAAATQHHRPAADRRQCVLAARRRGVIRRRCRAQPLPCAAAASANPAATAAAAAAVAASARRRIPQPRVVQKRVAVEAAMQYEVAVTHYGGRVATAARRPFTLRHGMTVTRRSRTTVTHDGHTRRSHTTVTHDGHTRRSHTTVKHDGQARRSHTTHDGHARRSHTTVTHDGQARWSHTTVTHDGHTRRSHTTVTHDGGGATTHSPRTLPLTQPLTPAPHTTPEPFPPRTYRKGQLPPVVRLRVERPPSPRGLHTPGMPTLHTYRRGQLTPVPLLQVDRPQVVERTVPIAASVYYKVRANHLSNVPPPRRRASAGGLWLPPPVAVQAEGPQLSRQPRGAAVAAKHEQCARLRGKRGDVVRARRRRAAGACERRELTPRNGELGAAAERAATVQVKDQHLRALFDAIKAAVDDELTRAARAAGEVTQASTASAGLAPPSGSPKARRGTCQELSTVPSAAALSPGNGLREGVARGEAGGGVG